MMLVGCAILHSWVKPTLSKLFFVIFMLENHPPQIKTLDIVHRGKVRDIYDLGDGLWLIVASDRLSAFDVILPTPISGKGAMLTDISSFWFNKTEHLIANHCVADFDLSSRITEEEMGAIGGAGVVVKKLKPLPIEAIVRGYLIGSGWAEYQKTGEVCGISLPANLQQAGKLPEVIYTPSTKASLGQNDENISYQKSTEIIGEELAAQIRDISLTLYQFAAEYALERGIIIADTKFEFGLDENDQLVVMDEMLTPDSSRFWDAKEYQEGTSPPSFDKQIVRDYLNSLEWDKSPPGPNLPDEIISRTKARYQEVISLLKSNL